MRGQVPRRAARRVAQTVPILPADVGAGDANRVTTRAVAAPGVPVATVPPRDARERELIPTVPKYNAACARAARAGVRARRPAAAAARVLATARANGRGAGSRRVGDDSTRG